ncbi:MAG TPA: tRNA (adenosine(37)-N6)-dimethylallyltransferase MiaA [Dehalococcoidia bacterium]
MVAVVGPTATGKTALAVRLAARFGGEVVNADSRQVYRGMAIGTAQPAEAERAAAPHHLFAVVEPDQPFSLGLYLDLAGRTLAEIWARGHVPFLVGGTGQYVWALLEGWQVPRVPPAPAVRAALEERARREGAAALHRELAAVDPETAARIHPHNVHRVIRALEVYRATGQPPSRQRARRPPGFRALVLGLTCDRTELYRRIDARVEAMYAAGLVEEVRDLLARGYGRDLPAMRSIGYREAAAYLAGELTLAEAVARTKTETHRLARTQEAWFRRSDPRIHWLDCRRPDGAEALVRRFLEEGEPGERTA